MGSVHSRHSSDLNNKSKAQIVKDLNQLVVVATGHNLGTEDVSSQITQIAEDIKKWKRVHDMFHEEMHKMALKEKDIRLEAMKQQLQEQSINSKHFLQQFMHTTSQAHSLPLLHGGAGYPPQPPVIVHRTI